MEYILVEASLDAFSKNRTKSLVEKVNEKINEGWKPMGGICIDGLSLYQAMVKE